MGNKTNRKEKINENIDKNKIKDNSIEITKEKKKKEKITQNIDKNILKEDSIEKTNEKNKNKKISQNIINNKLNENSIEITNEKNIKEYHDKINYIFCKKPIFKYKCNINNNVDIYGTNDLFEIYISPKDNKEYIALRNLNYNIDIFTILDNKLVLSLQGHNCHITTTRYFINRKNNHEYLISGDVHGLLFLWDISNNYNKIYKINTSYGDWITSSLIVFLENNKDNYIITNTCRNSNPKEETNVYSLENSHFIKKLSQNSAIRVWYLISW